MNPDEDINISKYEKYVDDYISARRGASRKPPANKKELSDQITSKPSGNGECMGDQWELTMGEIHAFRSWNKDHKGRLTSPQQSFIWKPGLNTAFDREHYTEKGGYGITHRDTPHGFFAYTDTPNFHGDVKGVIKASGWVTEGTRGITAEHAEIVALVDPTLAKPKKVSKPSDAPPKDRFGTGRYATNFLKAGSKYPKPETLGGIGFVFTALSIVGLGATFFAAAWALSIIAGLSILAGVLFVTWVVKTDNVVDRMKDERRTKGGPVVAKKSREKVYTLKDLYPNVTFYATLEEMLDAYSDKIVSLKPPPPTPEDEEFWL